MLIQETILSNENLLLQRVTVKTELSRRWASISKADIESRVVTVCKAFDKITADKVISHQLT